MFDWISALFHSSWVFDLLLTLYIITIVTVIALVVLENRNPVKTLAWATVLLLLPGLGILFYAVFGRNLRNTRMISKRNRRKLRKKESFRRVRIDKLGLKPDSVELIRLTKSLDGAIFYPNNDLDIYTNGYSMFRDLLRDIKVAEHSINMQFYIIRDEKIGRAIKDVLIEKAQAGVTVRVIYDSVGSFSLRGHYFDDLAKAGVQAYPFFKVEFPNFGSRINWRNHRKICIIDEKIGYIGGMNIADRYIDGGKNFATWRDTHCRLVGPAVGGLLFSFAVDWNFMGRPLITDVCKTDKGEESDNCGAGVQLLVSGPTMQWSNPTLLFMKAIGNARQRVYIQTPYILPTNGLLNCLQAAALAGVDVRLMLPARSDSRMLDYASFSYVTECLQAGIKIYLYEAGMLHAKMLLVDDEFVSIGSTNFDFRSFEHNFEANINIYSSKINARMDEIFLQDLRQSRRLNLTEWKKRPRRHKVMESIVRLLSPIL